ncbi:MAG: DEAD/DEAH box helicase [Gammaproteobacteria bacterium]|nr:DEAD/DEAH box helicase [Gammaproteobacteria bacterium]MBU1655884.1 DEAD/DEAH box helicase [Gammaproteobacteria bacterium]MBU1961019.1 DEAD/DEAH box helicase [Gammaproteobacteria bacterium]
MSKHHLTQVTFDSLVIDPEILQGIHEAGFYNCTPIQALSLPIALAGHDVAGQAQTGTGKTAAFLIAVFQRLLGTEPDPSHPRAVILAPTRELAVQIHKDAEVLGKHCGLRIGLVYGGSDYEKQREMVKAGLDVLIGTPGRLIDFHKQHLFNLNHVQAVVLDEADRMFDLGFIKDIRFLLRRMPPPHKRLGMLFSATLSYRVTELAYEHMNNPRSLVVETENVTADRVLECAYMVANEEKIPLLIGLMRHSELSRTIVFVNTKRTADKVWGYLEGNGIPAAILSGDVPQQKRLSLLKKFQQGEVKVLVATDVAARGLHIPDVSHVINYDLPDDCEDYVHRVGRTARAGASGDAISFVCETHAFSLPDIEAFIRHKIPVKPVEGRLLAEISRDSLVRREAFHPSQERRGGGDTRRRQPRRSA